MKASSLRNKTIEELNSDLEVLLKDHLKNRVDSALNIDSIDVSIFKKTRKDIARVKTIIRQKTM